MKIHNINPQNFIFSVTTEPIMFFLDVQLSETGLVIER